MRILVAPDSFKGTLTAAEAAEAIAAGLFDGYRAARLPEPEVDSCPMADGGEGTAEVLLGALGGEWVPRRVSGPLPGMEVEAGFALLQGPRPVAVVELAQASGLTLLRPDQRNPLRTTTRGTGELIRAAAERGAAEIWLTLGGSATVDGGIGMARSLGWRFLDDAGEPVPEGGGGLGTIAGIEAPAGAEALPPVVVLCDVTNPLLGPSGAAAVFGPQKGAAPEEVEGLERGLANLASRVDAPDLGTTPGAGAAGGAGFGAAAFLGGELRSGFEVVAEAVGLAERMRSASMVVTGEGRLDSQSLEGKVVAGLLAFAERISDARGTTLPVAAVAGTSELAPDLQVASGLRWVETLYPSTSGLLSMPQGPQGLPLREAARRLVLGQVVVDNRQ
jgi:glycerate kinase